MNSSGIRKPHRIRMLVPLWGAHYYEQWLSLAVPALMASGNILHLNQHAEFELALLCKSQDLDFLHNNATIRRLGGQIRLKMITIDEFFPPRTAVPYGVPLTLAYAKGIQDLGEDGLGSFVILLNADFVLSEGSLAQVLRRLDAGYHIVTAPSLRVVDHEVRLLLEDRLQNRGDAHCFSPRAMMALAERHLHQTVGARIINRDRPIGAWYYHLVYWRVSPTCLAGRSFLLMPLCFQVRRQAKSVICPVDYGFIQEYCPGGRYTAIGDSDELLMIELQARDCEAELLEVAPRLASAAEAMEYRVATIAANAAEWSTAEHRRAFSQPLLFHSGDPPADMPEQLTEFDRQIARIIERLPPPVSAIRHYHWLGAVRAYTSEPSEDGEPFQPQLLRDDGNRMFITLVEIMSGSAAHAREEWPATPPGSDFPAKLGAAIDAGSVVITLDGLVNEVRRINPKMRIFPVQVGELHGPAATVELPPHSVAPGSTLAAYLLTNSLPHWPKLKGACDAVLAGGGRAVVAFRDPLWTSFDPRLSAHSWMLSVLERFFGSDDYLANIELIPAEPRVYTEPFPWRAAAAQVASLCYGFIVTLQGGLGAGAHVLASDSVYRGSALNRSHAASADGKVYE